MRWTRASGGSTRVTGAMAAAVVDGGAAAVGATAPLVRIRGLRLEASTQRGTAHILRGLDLDIGRGRILGVVGESGSGKSSLATCLLRLLPSNVTRLAGRIEFDGTDLLALDDAAMADWRGRRIAMIFQDPMTALNPLFTVATDLHQWRGGPDGGGPDGVHDRCSHGSRHPSTPARCAGPPHRAAPRRTA